MLLLALYFRALRAAFVGAVFGARCLAPPLRRFSAATQAPDAELRPLQLLLLLLLLLWVCLCVHTRKRVFRAQVCVCVLQLGCTTQAG